MAFVNSALLKQRINLAAVLALFDDLVRAVLGIQLQLEAGLGFLKTFGVSVFLVGLDGVACQDSATCLMRHQRLLANVLERGVYGGRVDEASGVVEDLELPRAILPDQIEHVRTSLLIQSQHQVVCLLPHARIGMLQV